MTVSSCSPTGPAETPSHWHRCRGERSGPVHATVVGVFTAAAVVPSPPLLFPPLGGTGDDVVNALRSAVTGTVHRLAELAERWVVVGVGPIERRIGTDAVGTFGGFGADLVVRFSETAATPPDPGLPLAALVAAGLRGVAASSAVCEALIVAEGAEPGHCADLGAALRRELDSDGERRGILVVADGATTLTEKAPGYYDPRAADVETELERALSTGDTAALTDLDPVLCRELGIAGRSAFQVLAAACPSKSVVSTLYCGAPFGVGYYAGLWQPDVA